jgi:hypothetical protein
MDRNIGTWEAQNVDALTGKRSVVDEVLSKRYKLLNLSESRAMVLLKSWKHDGGTGSSQYSKKVVNV